MQDDAARQPTMAERAEALRSTGRHREEAALLRQWIAQDDQAQEPRLLLARCCLALNRPVQAVAAIRAAIAGGPVEPDLRAALVDCLKRLRQPEEAIAAAQAAVAASPGLAAAHLLLGDILIWAGRRRAAHDAYAAALAADPAHAEARLALAVSEPPAEGGAGLGPLLGGLLAAMVAEPAPEAAWLDLIGRLVAAQRPAAAIGAVRRAIRVHPAIVSLRLRHAALLLSAGDVAAALEEYGAAVAMAPDRPEPWLGLTDALWRERRFEEGLAAVRQATAAHPEHPVLLARLASFLLTGSDAPGAERAARAALSLNPQDEGTHIALAEALWRQERVKDSLRAVEEAAVLMPGSVPIAMRLGHLLLAQDAPGPAAEAFEKAVAVGRAPAHAWIGLTESLWRTQRIPEAAEAARRGIAAHPGSTELKARLGQFLLASGDAAAAHAALSQALDDDPASEAVHIAMADALWRQGRRGEAIVAARQAVAAVPDKPEVAARLGHMLLEADEIAEAAALFERVTQEAPGLVAGWTGLCEAERLRKRIKPALEAARRAEAAGADRQTIRMMRYRLFGELEE